MIHQAEQCCGSGSVGSICFWASWIRILLSESGSRSFFHQAKIVRKTLVFTVLWILFDFLSLKNDVNVPSKSNNNYIISFLLAPWRSITKRAGSESPTEMSWIRNTAAELLFRPPADADLYLQVIVHSTLASSIFFLNFFNAFSYMRQKPYEHLLKLRYLAASWRICFAD